MIRASSPAASRTQASPRSEGLAYSNGAGFIERRAWGRQERAGAAIGCGTGCYYHREERAPQARALAVAVEIGGRRWSSILGINAAWAPVSTAWWGGP